jgi:hypothetical protein
MHGWPPIHSHVAMHGWPPMHSHVTMHGWPPMHSHVTMHGWPPMHSHVTMHGWPPIAFTRYYAWLATNAFTRYYAWLATNAFTRYYAWLATNCIHMHWHWSQPHHALHTMCTCHVHTSTRVGVCPSWELIILKLALVCKSIVHTMAGERQGNDVGCGGNMHVHRRPVVFKLSQVSASIRSLTTSQQILQLLLAGAMIT